MKIAVSKKSIIAIIVLASSWNACALEELEVPTWTGIEVITNDKYSKDVVRRVVQIKSGARISYSDPILQLYCDTVRDLLPVHEVRCRAIQMDGGTALYAVDVQTKRRLTHKKAPCSLKRLSPDLVNVAETYYVSHGKTLERGGAFGAEFINDVGYLDFVGPSAHELHRATHLATTGRFADLARGTKSCVARDRSDAIWLMNFSGLQVKTFDFAFSLLDDSDEAVRNNASRTVASFINSMPDPERRRFSATRVRRSVKKTSWKETRVSGWRTACSPRCGRGV